MDLFVINRYRDDNEDVNLVDQETRRLQALREKIEERKKAYTATTQRSDVIILNQNEPSSTIQDANLQESEPADLRQQLDIQTTENTETTQQASKSKPTNEFKVLGVNDFEKKSKVERVLPHWLTNPCIISTDMQNLTCLVENQEWLNSTLKTTLLNEGVTHFFPVQEQVIPFILEEHKFSGFFWPQDICVSAPTGSGKTLAFVLPLIQILMEDVGHHIRALVVLPVQELAVQVSKVFKKYCTNTGLKVALLSGSTPLQEEQLQLVQYTELLGWISPVDIVVCTAGRLVEHLQNTDGFSLRHLKFLVIDEADRIMGNIQNDWLSHMDKHIKLDNRLMQGRMPSLNWQSLSQQKSPPHKLLFSATLSQDPEKLEKWCLFQPKLFSVSDDQIREYRTPNELTEEFVTCNASDKPIILFHLLTYKKWGKILCFANSAQTAHRLTKLINIWGKGKIQAGELSSYVGKTVRESALNKFIRSEINVLICTDALARGIDVADCDCVVSYDLPKKIQTYVHRVGRTGRAGRKGHALIILLENQLKPFMELIKAAGKVELPQIKIDQTVIDGFTDDFKEAMRETKSQIDKETKLKMKKAKKLKRGSRVQSQKRKLESSNMVGRKVKK